MKQTTTFRSGAHKERVMEQYDGALANFKGNIRQQAVPTSFGETHVISYGNEDHPKLILLHGANSNAASWMKDLALYSKEYKVYAIDIIGEPGKSEQNRLPYKGNYYSDWLFEVFQQLKITKFSLVGLSQGGWLAIKFAARYPEKISQLVLLSPGGIVKTQRSFVFKAIFFSLLGNAGKRKINKLITGSQKIDQSVLDFMSLMQSSVNARIDKEYIFSDEELKNMTMPVFFIGGAGDVVRDSQQIKERLEGLLPDFESYVDPDKGHVLVGLADKINAFLLKRRND
ncbi:alpha/beta fold hydrolase [Chryseobacterium sp. AG363]|uniref:alpha/beta fold hydrolase n=1 Tax=Chryseobacterium sp. AG363 TaxID=2183997 RepID=UPI000E74A9D3|nr:alpha/beta hydrolase [Chryseobacterium sp. AG363]RKE82475.1 pimeloyl-ACP methyl ester carboxylesterase [Chryseobacterium sp. AG363]